MAKRDLLLNNFWWKVTALIVAIFVRYTLRTREADVPFSPPNFAAVYNTRELVSHPIIISKPATDTREFRVIPSDVNITISGDVNKLKKIEGMEIQATIDLSNIKGATNTVPIKVYVPPGSGIRLEKLSPERVQVELKEQPASSEAH